MAADGVRSGLVSLLAALLAACAGNGDGLDENGRPLDDETPVQLLPEFDSIQQHVLTPVCGTCHTGAAAPLGLRLDDESAYALLVNAPSVEVPSLLRVNPGDADASYLIQKIEGTAAVGGRMPLNGAPLSADTIAIIRQWIIDGAQPPATVAATIGTAGLPAATIHAAWPTTAAVLDTPPQAIVLAAGRELDSTRIDAGTVQLLHRGPDGADVPVPIRIQVRSLQPSVLAVSTNSWNAGRYQLRLSDAITDLDARPIDGDRDGNPGGDFVLEFSVENAP